MEPGSRDKILERVRRALYRPSNEKGSGPESSHQENDYSLNENNTMQLHKGRGEDGSDLIGLFASELTRVNGIVKVVSSDEEVWEYISDLTTQTDAKTCMAWETDLIKKLSIIERLQGAGLKMIKSQSKEECAKADIGITGADYAIADSGTLVLFSAPGKQRLASLIAPVHVAILESRNILHNIFQLFQIAKCDYNPNTEAKDPPACLTFITGPSRTADIELNLTLGVHGPKQLHTLIL